MTTTKIIGDKGDRVDLLVSQGRTCGPFYLTILRKDGTPEDLTGCQFVSEIRKTPSSSVVNATALVTLTAPTLGKVRFEFPASQTKDITADDSDETHPDSVYTWDFEVHYPSGRKRPVFYGTVYVFREVSKGEPA